MFELDCIIWLALNRKMLICMVIQFTGRLKLKVTIIDKPDITSYFLWMFSQSLSTHSLTFLCVFAQSDCVLACQSKVRQAYVSSCFSEKCKHIYAVFLNEFVYYSVWLSLLDLWSVLYCNEIVSGMSGSETWNAQTQELHINLLESSSAYSIFSCLQTLLTSILFLLLVFLLTEWWGEMQVTYAHESKSAFPIFLSCVWMCVYMFCQGCQVQMVIFMLIFMPQSNVLSILTGPKVWVYVRVCFISVMSAAVFSYSPIKPNYHWIIKMFY